MPTTKDYILNQARLNKARNFAYFDFDGTITKGDTFLPYIIYTCGIRSTLFKVVSLIYIMLLKFFKITPSKEAKQKVLTLMLKGREYNWMQAKAKEFAEKKLIRYIQPNIYKILLQHIKQGDGVILVSANLDIFLLEWAKLHNITALVSTNLEFIDGVFTGNISSNNCFGPEKVARVKAFLATNQIEVNYSYAYGNSEGDYELLTHANEGFFIHGHKITSWTQHPHAKL